MKSFLAIFTLIALPFIALSQHITPEIQLMTGVIRHVFEEEGMNYKQQNCYEYGTMVSASIKQKNGTFLFGIGYAHENKEFPSTSNNGIAAHYQMRNFPIRACFLHHVNNTIGVFISTGLIISSIYKQTFNNVDVNNIWYYQNDKQTYHVALSVGLRYNLWKNLTFQLEPYLRDRIQKRSQTNNEFEGRINRFSLGLNFGLNYNLGKDEHNQ